MIPDNALLPTISPLCSPFFYPFLCHLLLNDTIFSYTRSLFQCWVRSQNLPMLSPLPNQQTKEVACKFVKRFRQYFRKSFIKNGAYFGIIKQISTWILVGLMVKKVTQYQKIPGSNLCKAYQLIERTMSYMIFVHGEIFAVDYNLTRL